jgi:hypothetical protein
MTTQHLQSDVKKRFRIYSDSTQQKHKFEKRTQNLIPECRIKLQNVETNSITQNQTPERRRTSSKSFEMIRRSDPALVRTLKPEHQKLLGGEITD